MRWKDCSTANVALLVLNDQFSFFRHEPGADYVLNRLRYATFPKIDFQDQNEHIRCHYYGWGSRRSVRMCLLPIHQYNNYVNQSTHADNYQIRNFENDFKDLEYSTVSIFRGT